MPPQSIETYLNVRLTSIFHKIRSTNVTLYCLRPYTVSLAYINRDAAQFLALQRTNCFISG